MDPVLQTYKYMDEREKRVVSDFKPREPRFNPSSVSKCAKRLGYKHLGTRPDMEDGKGWLSQYGPAGDFYHDQVRFEMRDAGVEFQGLIFHEDTRKVEEVDACKRTIEHKGQSLILSGRGDGRIKVDGTWMYNELKSVGAAKYRWMLSAYQPTKKFPGGRITSYLTEKYPEFIWQINMMCAPEMMDLPATYLTLINRDNCQFGFCDKNYENRKGIVIAFDEVLWEKQKDKMAMIQRLTDKGELPMAAESEGSKACGQCPYEKRCWG